MARYANKQNLITLVEALRQEYATPSWVKDAEELGSGLGIVDGTLTATMSEHSDGSTAGPILSLSAKGHAEQNGTPTPDSPVEIQTVTGHEVAGKTGRFVDLVVKQDDTTLSTTPIPLPSRGWAGSLPDGTADVLTLDGAGKVTWEKGTDKVVLDGSENSSAYEIAVTDAYSRVLYVPYQTNGVSNAEFLCDKFRHISPSPGIGELYAIWGSLSAPRMWLGLPIDVTTINEVLSWLSTHPVTVLYPLATPVTEERGYIEMPEIPVGAEISIPELDELGVDYVIPLPVVLQGYEDRIAALEAAIAELATS